MSRAPRVPLSRRVCCRRRRRARASAPGVVGGGGGRKYCALPAAREEGGGARCSAPAGVARARSPFFLKSGSIRELEDAARREARGVFAGGTARACG